MTIFNVQQADTLLAPCHPATLDTVWGVRGVITAFDAKPGAYGFYMQNTFANGPHAFTGVDVFTGATNYNSSVPGTPTGGNLLLGDSVVVYGTTQEFPNPSGETEIEGPDTFQNTNDIIIRKIAGGHALPPFKVGSTHDFNWVPGSPGNQGEQWEGCLVRINGPLRVARTNQGLGVAGNTFLIVNPTSPTDSVLIDGFTLTTYGAPPVGTAIGFVQGVLNQRNSTAPTGSVNSYRIQIRDANDIQADAPPNLIEAFPVEDNRLRLIFDKNLDPTTASDPANYSLGSGGIGSTVDNATLLGGSGTTVELDITSALSDGQPESVNAVDIGTASCAGCLMASQTLNFAQGVIPISMIQAPDPANLNPCDDRSVYAGPGTGFGTRFTTRGVAVQSYGSLYYIVTPSPAPKRSGVVIFAPSTPLVNGHNYKIACRVQEFGGETEIVNTVYILDEGVGTVPAPLLKTVAVLSDTTCDSNPDNRDTGEDYEGMLVRVEKVKVVNFNTPPTDPVAGGGFRVTQPVLAPLMSGSIEAAGPRMIENAPDTILVSGLNSHYTFDADSGDVLNVNGILHFDNGSFRILPRDDGDIEVTTRAGVGGGTPIEMALSIRPNPGRSHQISFAVPRKDIVDLAVFDLLGRRVSVIASGVLEAGRYTRRWNGLDASGHQVNSGMYFYRLRVGKELRTERAIKLD